MKGYGYAVELDRWGNRDLSMLTRLLLARLANEENKSDVEGFLRTLIDAMDRDKAWIAAQRRLLAEEGERIQAIGLRMRAAGLRSYTDPAGAIYVAHEPRRDRR